MERMASWQRQRVQGLGFDIQGFPEFGIPLKGDTRAIQGYMAFRVSGLGYDSHLGSVSS